MRNTHPRLALIVLSFLLGQPLLAFEPEPVQDAYLQGMGGAGAAVAGGTHAVFLNPAGTARSHTPLLQVGLGLGHSGEFRSQTSVLYPFRDGTVFSLSQGSDFPALPGSSTLVGATVGLPLDSSRDFLFGLNLKHISLSADLGGGLEGGTGFGLDLGWVYDVRNPQGTIASFALSFLDLASQVRFDSNQERSLSRRMVLGAAYLGVPETRLEADLILLERTGASNGPPDRLRIGAETFLADRFFSVRAGWDGILGQDDRIAFGFGYHPDRPFELCYAFQAPLEQGSPFHSLSFTWRFDEPGPGQGHSAPKFSGPSPEIHLAHAKLPPPVGRPVSPLPLRKVTVKVDPPFLSPGGTQNKTSVSFPEGGPLETAKWRLDILPPDGEALRTLEGTGNLPAGLVWDGRTKAGRPAGDGKYRLALKTFDSQGKQLSDDEGTVEVLSARPKFALRANDPYFSSRSNRGGRSEVRFGVEPGGPWEVAQWTFEVTEPGSGKKVLQQGGKGSLPRSLRWNGRSGKESVGEGVYLARLTAVDQAGNPLRADALRLTLDNNGPKIDFQPKNRLADPSGGESFRFSALVEDLSGVQVWKLGILRGNGGAVARLEGKGSPPADLSWDGRSAEGTMVEPGTLLMATFEAQDRAGNFSQTLPASLQVDFKPKAAGGQMTLNLATVRFPEKRADLDEAAKKQLASSAAAIREYLQKSVLVVKGYCAEGETEDPLLLSHQRAAGVRDYFIQTLGVPASSIYAIGQSAQKVTTTPLPPGGPGKAVVTLTTLP